MVGLGILITITALPCVTGIAEQHLDKRNAGGQYDKNKNEQKK
jgi:hypothetical protein